MLAVASFHTRTRLRIQMLQNRDWKNLIPRIIIVLSSHTLSTTSSFYYTHLYGFYHFIIKPMHP